MIPNATKCCKIVSDFTEFFVDVDEMLAEFAGNRQMLPTFDEIGQHLTIYMCWNLTNFLRVTAHAGRSTPDGRSINVAY